MARKKTRKSRGPRDSAWNLTNTGAAIVTANETTKLIANNPNVLDFLLYGWTHAEARAAGSAKYRLDGQLDLREMLSPLWGEHQSGVGRISSYETSAGHPEGFGNWESIGKTVMSNVTNGAPRFIFSSLAIPVGVKLFKDIAAPSLNKVLEMVPIGRKSRKPSQRGLRKYIKF